MRSKIVNPFLDSVVNVMSTMASIQVLTGTPEIKEDHLAGGDISGIIGMSSDTSAGSMAVSFPKNVILEITKRMLDEDLTTINGTVVDLVGELTNMISGGAKKNLLDVGLDIGMASPVIVFGDDHEIHHKSTGKTISLPFSTEIGEFYVEVCFDD